MRASRPQCALALFLTFALAASVAENGICDSGDETCSSDASKDNTALLQHPKKRQQLAKQGAASETETLFAARIGQNGSKPHKRRSVPKRKAKHASELSCKELGQTIARHKHVDLAHSFWKFVCHDKVRDHFHEVKDACVYLPGNGHVRRFFERVEGANPWHFIDMLEDSIFPMGEDGKCPTHGKEGHTVASLTGSEFETCKLEKGHGFVNHKGKCIKAELLEHARGPNIKVFSLDGMMGLVHAWERMMSEAGDDEQVHSKEKSLLQGHSDGMSNETLAEESEAGTKIPIQFFVCDEPGSNSLSNAITEKLLDKQMLELMKGYAGKDKCISPLAYNPPYTDTKIRFTRLPTQRIQSSLCAYDCTDNIPYLTQDVVPREDGMIKVLLCPTDLLGIASFPGDPDSKRVLIVNPDSLPGGAIVNYNYGDTLVHESGHYLGLYHTFQSGCGPGDQVPDTSDEQQPFYGCPTARLGHSCPGPKTDPVHDFMDYSDDLCMCSFTKGQKKRIYQQLKRYQRDLLTYR